MHSEHALGACNRSSVGTHYERTLVLLSRHSTHSFSRGTRIARVQKTKLGARTPGVHFRHALEAHTRGAHLGHTLGMLQSPILAGASQDLASVLCTTKRRSHSFSLKSELGRVVAFSESAPGLCAPSTYAPHMRARSMCQESMHRVRARESSPSAISPPPVLTPWSYAQGRCEYRRRRLSETSRTST